MRRRRAKIREVSPDPLYGSVEVAKFINRLMIKGKKSQARKAVYEAMAELGTKVETPPMDAFMLAIRNVTPSVEVRSRRVGGATYQVPNDVPPRRRLILAQRWIIQAARSRKGGTIASKLSQELYDAVRGVGVAVKRKEDVRRMSQANRAYVHHNW